MKKLNYFLLLSLVFMLIAGCCKLETQPELLNSSDDVTLKKKMKKKGNDHFVPFKATFEVYVDKVLKESPPPPKIQEVLGTGNATHLGKTGIYLKQWWGPTDSPGHGQGKGVITFTAANGDILKAEYDDAESFHESATVVYIEFTGIFKDGGTGRFEHAEGSFEWEGIFYPEVNKGTATIKGRIKYKRD